MVAAVFLTAIPERLKKASKYLCCFISICHDVVACHVSVITTTHCRGFKALKAHLCFSAVGCQSLTVCFFCIFLFHFHSH